MFNGIFDTNNMITVEVKDFLICVLTSIILGMFLAWIYSVKNSYTKSFMVTLAMLPAVVCVVIMMVNGNVGTGVAVAGSFSLVRFRSAPGNAKDIGMIFLAMGAGLITGMGYIAYAGLFVVVMGVFVLLLTVAGFGEDKKNENARVLRITIPEDLNYVGIFDDLFEDYLDSAISTSVKTTNMGAYYKLTYDVVFKDVSKQKEFIDEVRCRNGNLEISLNKKEVVQGEL